MKKFTNMFRLKNQNVLTKTMFKNFSVLGKQNVEISVTNNNKGIKNNRRLSNFRP